MHEFANAVVPSLIPSVIERIWLNL
uniref:Uncharacterized protein n=1 Tax=Arundo donax TaxID=35708 RepID=A0A0A9F8N4_ARUDO